MVVDKEYQNNGIGTKLLELCSYNNENDIIYEAWGDNGKYSFFLFAENAELFQKVNNNRCVKNIIQCNMEYEELTKCLGYGFYSRVIPGFYTPVPEFKIQVKDFKMHTIKNISRTIKDE